MFGALCAANVAFDGDFVRNIASPRSARSVFDDLSDDPADWELAASAEAVSRSTAPDPVIVEPFDFGSVVTYSFDPSNWQATRFSDARRYAAWYGSLDVATTVYETLFHWHRFLADSYAGVDRVIIAERTVFDVRCHAVLVDLRGKEIDYPDLISRTSYAFTQALGAFVHDQGLNGVVVRSARCDGVNAAILQAARLSNVRERTQLRYRCNPAVDLCMVEQVDGAHWMQVVPSSLG